MSRGFLLDTHALLWWFYEAESLSSHAMDVMADGSIDVFVSAVSAMEIATKFRRKQLPAAAPLVEDFVGIVEAEGFQLLPISAKHAIQAGSLTGDLADPWDRLLVAQAQIERLSLVSRDQKIERLGIEKYW
jgi:PIN domain nuclease of toxin-antitoxin system